MVQRRHGDHSATRTLFAVAIAGIAAAAAQAQTADGNTQRPKPPMRPRVAPPSPSYSVPLPSHNVPPPANGRPGSIPMPGVGVLNPVPSPTGPVAGAFAPRGSVFTGSSMTPYGAQRVPPPVATPMAPGYYHFNGATYYCAPNNVWYYYPGYYGGGGGQTVVVTSPSPYGYPYPYQGTTITTPGSVGVQSSTVQSTVTLSGGTTISVFSGYAPVYVAGQTFPSPFGSLYGCPPYIRSEYVRTSPYPYARGNETQPVHVWSDEDSFVSDDARRAAGLRTALNDLTRFWENGDSSALRRHVDSDLSVAVFRGGRFLYSLERADLLALCEDARVRVSTVAFRFTDIRKRDDGLVNAYARHTYRLPGESAVSTPQAATVRCSLVYVGGGWRLSAVSFASNNQD